jgi:hypothetical protein
MSDPDPAAPRLPGSPGRPEVLVFLGVSLDGFIAGRVATWAGCRSSRPRRRKTPATTR